MIFLIKRYGHCSAEEDLTAHPQPSATNGSPLEFVIGKIFKYVVDCTTHIARGAAVMLAKVEIDVVTHFQIATTVIKS